MESYSACIVIPVYNHGEATKITSEKIHLNHPELPIVLIDDGSDDECKTILKALAQKDNIYLVSHDDNQGKGGAVKTGLRQAQDLGFSHGLQVDADGQHDIGDIHKFLDLGRKHQNAIICGYPEYDESVPKVRLYARYITHVWIWINTLSFKIIDSMCGFRLYPLNAVNLVVKQYKPGDRMDFDPELLVYWHWENNEIVNIATAVQYPIDGISHFRKFEDNYLISTMHARLFIGMLIRLPRILSHKFSATKQAE